MLASLIDRLRPIRSVTVDDRRDVARLELLIAEHIDELMVGRVQEYLQRRRPTKTHRKVDGWPRTTLGDLRP